MEINSEKNQRNMQHKLLIGSGVLNIALLVLFLRGQVGTGTDTKSEASKRPAQASMVVTPDVSDDATIARLKALHTALVSAGVDDTSAKRTVLASVETATPTIPRSYWKLNLLSTAEERIRAYETQERLREIIGAVFGSSASTDQAFASIFAPYSALYPFLSPEKQRRLQSVEKTASEARLQASATSLSPGVGNAPAGQKQVRQELANFMSAEELFEYDMRTSFTAQRLIATGFDFTEQEFRAIYKLVESPAGAAVSEPDLTGALFSHDQKRDAAKAALGQDRYAEFERFQDPSYRVLLAVTRSHGITGDKVRAAYEIIREYQSEMVAGSDPRKSGSSMDKEAARRSKQERDRIVALLGEEVFVKFSAIIDATRGAPARARVAAYAR